MIERGAPLRPGDPERIGPYRVLARLGAGGMGVVFLANDAGGRPVAVKVVHAEMATDDEFRNRFRSEVARVRQVPGFCTAEVLDADPDATRPYLVTEFVDGPTLAAEVAQRGPLSTSNLHAVAIGVATALTAIHEAGVIHRDLKPHNVLLAPGTPKVIDFGIARAWESTTQHTRTGQIVGTANYMAPERFDETGGPTGPAADVFAWGCVVTFAGTGRAPFHADSPLATFGRILTQEPELGTLDGPLRQLVERSLRRDPRDRPTARELLDLLLRGGPARTPQPVEALDDMPALRTAAIEVQATPGPVSPPVFTLPTETPPESAFGPAAPPPPYAPVSAAPASPAFGPASAPPYGPASAPPFAPASGAPYGPTSGAPFDPASGAPYGPASGAPYGAAPGQAFAPGSPPPYGPGSPPYGPGSGAPFAAGQPAFEPGPGRPSDVEPETLRLRAAPGAAAGPHAGAAPPAGPWPPAPGTPHHGMPSAHPTPPGHGTHGMPAGPGWNAAPDPGASRRSGDGRVLAGILAGVLLLACVGGGGLLAAHSAGAFGDAEGDRTATPTSDAPAPEPSADVPAFTLPAGDPLIADALTSAGQWNGTYIVDEEDSNCDVRDGALRVQRVTPGSYICAGPEEKVDGDHTIAVTGTIEKPGSCLGIWLFWEIPRSYRLTACESAFRFEVDREDGSGYSIREVRLDRALPRNEPVRLQVVVEDGTVRFGHDGVLIGEADLPEDDITEGVAAAIGMISAPGDENPPYGAHFNDVEVRTLED